jgi:ATP-binding cassette, subfamily B, bacterial MsbA
MKYFARAILDSIHHWPMLLLATLCSVGVATLWSANIGAMYPVIEMTLKGNSTQSQLTERANSLEQHVASQKIAVERLQEQLESNGSATDIDSSTKSLQWAQFQLDLAKRFLPNDPFKTICWIMVLMVVSTMLRHVLLLANDMLIGRVSTTIARSMRRRVFDQAMLFDRRTFQNYGTSGLLAAITHTSDGLTNGLIAFFGLAIREPLRIIACLIGAALVCPRLLMLCVLLAPLLVLSVYWFNGRVKGIARSMIGKNTGLHEVILEALSNIFTVQAYTMEAEERKRFGDCTQDMQRCSMRMIFYTGLSKPVTELIGVGMIAITICAGAYLIVNRQTHIFFLRICDQPMSPSDLMIFFAMLIGASDPLRKMSGVMTAIYGGALAAESLYQMLDRPVVLPQPTEPAIVASPHTTLTVQEVSFGYVAGSHVLHNVSLEVPFGQTVVILGSNGSGKSTLIQLLCRFYDPESGGISLDGVDYRKMTIESIRRRIALVSQQTELFNRSVLENIQYGSPGSTREQAIEAAKVAHAHEFITNVLENGYDTVVGQGGQRLSGGQRQRIAMARAILRRPEILILDESTSQIDMASELEIRRSLSELKRQCTIIIITHREALIELADVTYEIRAGHLHCVDRRLGHAA